MKISLNFHAAFVEALLQRVRALPTELAPEAVLSVSFVTDSDGALVVHLLCLHPGSRRKVVVSLDSTPGTVRVTYLKGDTVPAVVVRYTDASSTGLLPALWPEILHHLSTS